MTDGYFSRSEKFKTCSENQNKLNLRLKEIANEIAILPKLPQSMEDWIDSWTDPSKKGFSMSAFNKHLKIKKEYSKLIDSSNSNLREMKILVIEELLEKINNTLNNGSD